MVDNWSAILQSSFQELWLAFVRFVPNFIVAVVIFLIGWAIASLLDKVVAQIVKSVKVDQALRGLKVEEGLKRAGFSLNSGAFVGKLVKWFVIIAFLVAALDALGLGQVNLLFQQIVLYLPYVIAAAFILLAAALISEVIQRVVAGAAKAAGIRSANFAGAVAHWAIWIFAILLALSQLGIASPFIQTFFTGIVIAVAIAVGLAFGLGGQEAAARCIERVRNEIAAHHHE